jgi:hypothetical protein
MFPANAYVIRYAAAADARAVHEIARLDSQRPLEGRVLIGEIDGRVAAAISLDDSRVVADPFESTARLTPFLRMRASALREAERVPSVAERLRAGVRVARPAHA